MKLIAIGISLCAASFAMQIEASEVETKITEEKAYSSVLQGTEYVKIQRNQDTNPVIEDSSAKTSRPCPPFCVNPLSIAADVETFAELEVIEFMEKVYKQGGGAVIDVRPHSSYQQGTIPGSTNIPFTVFEKAADDAELAEVLESMGARERDKVGAIQRGIESLGFFDGHMKTDKWDFTKAKELLIWCDDPLCEQSPRAIHALVKLGYPAEKVKYYRGGMQMWKSLGLTTVVPSENSAVASR